MELEYRVKTTTMGNVGVWQRVTTGGLTWDCRDTEIKIEFFEIRVKPEFVPGWYQYVGVASTPENSLHYFRTIEDGGLDVDCFDRDYKRYDITPAE